MHIRLLLNGLCILTSLVTTCNASSQRPLTSPQRHETSLLHLHRKLVEIESTTGNEAKVGEYLVSYLEALNLTVEKQAVAPVPATLGHTSPSRFNILAYPGSKSQTRTLLTSHIDTVPPYIPYERRESGTEIWGRGSVDAKACVAAQILAFTDLYTSGKIGEGDVGLLFVVGEETNGAGMKTVNELDMSWEAVVFGEPTEGKLVSGHKGIFGFSLEVQGTAAHSGYPWLGQSANEILVSALAGLLELAGRNGTEDGGLPASEKYGKTTLNVGTIQGGVAGNVVAQHAEARFALRLAAGTPEEAYDLCLNTIKESTAAFFGKDGTSDKASMKTTITNSGYGPVDIDDDIDGFEGGVTVNYGTDLPNLKGNHKRYLYGPGSIFVAHSDHEHLKVSELEQAVEDYKSIIIQLLDR